MTLNNAFAFTGALGIFAIFVFFAVWFALTIAVLCVMEGTSAMLHSLRLLHRAVKVTHILTCGVFPVK